MACVWDGNIGSDRAELEEKTDSQVGQTNQKDSNSPTEPPPPPDDASEEESDELGSDDTDIVESDEESDDDDDDDDDDLEPPPDAQECVDQTTQPPCDESTNDYGHILGINCHQANSGLQFDGDPRSLLIVDRPFGRSNYWSATEGQRMLALSSGIAESLLHPVDDRDFHDKYCPQPPHNSQDPSSFGGIDRAQIRPCPSFSFFRERSSLPWPMTIRPVDPQFGSIHCGKNNALIGGGDCSNSLVNTVLSRPPTPEHPGISNVHDYAELRIELKVPLQTTGLTFDFAFFSTERPRIPGFPPPPSEPPSFDAFTVWLESNLWTGNLIFDPNTNKPLSSHSTFIEYNDTGFPEGPTSVAEQLHETGMQGNVATPWRRSVAPVMPGETITLVFAIFDTLDGRLDSLALLDNFRWTCHDRKQPIVTSIRREL